MQDHIHERIEAYTDGVLDSAGRRQVEDHLAGCGKCAAAWDNYRGAQSLLGHLKPSEAPPVPGPDFYFKVRRSIAEREADAGWFSMLPSILRNPRFAYPLFALFFGLLITAFSMDYSGDFDATGIFGAPRASVTRVAASSGDRRESVMLNLVEMEEEEF